MTSFAQLMAWLTCFIPGDIMRTNLEIFLWQNATQVLCECSRLGLVNNCLKAMVVFWKHKWIKRQETWVQIWALPLKAWIRLFFNFHVCIINFSLNSFPRRPCQYKVETKSVAFAKASILLTREVVESCSLDERSFEATLQERWVQEPKPFFLQSIREDGKVCSGKASLGRLHLNVWRKWWKSYSFIPAKVRQ